MTQMRGLSRVAGYVAVGLVYLGLLPRAMAAGQALVIGEASYSGLPTLPGCTLSAHAVAAALRGLGFTVDEQDDSSNGALYAAIGALTRNIVPSQPAFVYFCGYVTSFEDRPFVLPVSANVSRPGDALTQGLLAKTLLDTVEGGKAATAVLAIDAVPLPNAALDLSLDELTRPAMPPTLGYIATSTGAPGNTPTPLASVLVPLLRDKTTETAKLLSDGKLRLAGLKTASVVALHLPDTGLYLAGAPAQPVPAATTAPGHAVSPTQPPPSPPPAASSQAEGSASGAPAESKSLPDEEQMSDDQRRLVQRALAHLGYYDAKADGVFGPETRAAIRRWQHEIHAPMTGHLSAAEASKLGASWD